MAAQYELLKELLNSGTKLSFGQDFFFKFYQAFLLKDRWMQYINGVGTTLLVTALALALGVVLGSVGSAAGRLLMPLLSDRIGRRPTDLILFGVSLGLSAAFLFAQGWLVVAVYAGLTFCYSALAAVLPSLSTDLFGLPHAGVNYGFLALGQSVGSLAFPFAANLWGLATGRHWLAMAGAAAGFVCIWALRPVRAQQPPRKN